MHVSARCCLCCRARRPQGPTPSSCMWAHPPAPRRCTCARSRKRHASTLRRASTLALTIWVQTFRVFILHVNEGSCRAHHCSWVDGAVIMPSLEGLALVQGRQLAASAALMPEMPGP